MSITHSRAVINGKEYHIGETSPELYLRGQILRAKTGGQYLVPVKSPEVKRGKIKGITPQSAMRLRAKCECYRLKGNPPTVYLGCTCTLGWVQNPDNLARIQKAYAEMSHTFFKWFHRRYSAAVLIYRNEQQVGRISDEGKPHFHALIMAPSETPVPAESMFQVEAEMKAAVTEKWLELQRLYAARHGLDFHDKAARLIGVRLGLMPNQGRQEAIARYLAKHAAKNGDQNTYPGRAWGVVNESNLEPCPAVNLIPPFCCHNPEVVQRAMVYLRREARKFQRYELSFQYFRKCVKTVNSHGVEFIPDYFTPGTRRLWKRYLRHLGQFSDGQLRPQYVTEFILCHHGIRSNVHCLVQKRRDYGTLHPMPLKAALSKGLTLDGVSTPTQLRLVLEAFKRALKDF